MYKLPLVTKNKKIIIFLIGSLRNYGQFIALQFLWVTRLDSYIILLCLYTLEIMSKVARIDFHRFKRC